MPATGSKHSGSTSAGAKAHSNGSAQKVVGPNVQGNREEYQLVRRLQSALFGGVYEAKGLTSRRDFAIKVLHKSELTKAQEANSMEFCEVPLSEIRFAEHMAGHPNVMEPEEHFEDAYCFYIVFELARGGDLLEALKLKPHGFDEGQAQFLIKQAAKGLALLHERQVAMQDVSLENCLLHVPENSAHYTVKVCDPGQAVIFEVDKDGYEVPVQFRGLVGKSFRPPELHEQQPYSATKVDSWCLGWSTFYLLTAQPLFMSADPAQQDPDWLLFQQGDFATLFQQKCNLCSPTGLDFIFKLLAIEPRRRMSVAEALNHSWLKEGVCTPLPVPKEILSEYMLSETERRPLENLDNSSSDLSPGSLKMPGSPKGQKYAENGGPVSNFNMPVKGVPDRGGLPTWAAANSDNSLHGNGMAFAQSYSSSQLSSDVPSIRRVPTPPRSPHSPRVNGGPTSAFDRVPVRQSDVASMDLRGRSRHVNPSRMAQVISTAHSPVPQPYRGSPMPRVGSPLHRQLSPRPSADFPGVSGLEGSSTGLARSLVGQPLQQDGYAMDPMQPSAISPRHGRARSPFSGGVPTRVGQAGDFENEERTRSRAWAFRSESPGAGGSIRDGAPRRALSPIPGQESQMMMRVNSGTSSPFAPSRNSPPNRFAQSPSRNSGQGITFPRSLSPGLLEQSSLGQPATAVLRAHSPGSAGARASEGGIPGFNWSAAPPISPRVGGGAVSRISSPMASHVAGPQRIASPSGGYKPSTQQPQTIASQGFAWSPEPLSPPVSPRSFSPPPSAVPGVRGMNSSNSLPRWPPQRS